MAKGASTDYETYREIMNELLQPISATGLPDDTLKRLYESKMVYLENLRVKCFRELNNEKFTSHFSQGDYQLILKAIQQTRQHLRDLVMLVISANLAKRNVV